MKTYESTDVSGDRELTCKIMGIKVPTRVSAAGFSLVELVIIVAIIGVLVIISIPGYGMFVERAKFSRCSAEIRVLERDINAYFIEHDALPGSLSDIGRGDLRDPWGRFYHYLNIPQRADGPFEDLNADFDLYSVGPDGSSLPDITEAVSQDDVFRAGDGAWVGLGKNY